MYGKIKVDIDRILRKLCDQKNVEILEAEACPDHIHMLVSIPPLRHSTYLIECNMTKMIASIQEKNAAGEIKIHKYILTRKQTGNKLTYAEIKQRYENLFKAKTAFEAWKEALNGTCYEISFS